MANKIRLPKIEEGDFREVIGNAIKEDRHVDYLQNVLENYEWYQQEFKKVFADSNKVSSVYEFLVVYPAKKGLRRNIEMLGSHTFDRFARTIIKSMGWQNDHMHGFTIPGISKEKGIFDIGVLGIELEFFAPEWEDDPFPTYKSDQIKICHIDYAKHPKLDMVFDYGAGHQFEIFFKSERSHFGEDEKNKFPHVFNYNAIPPEQYPDYEE
jgi:hypothetical protein